MRSLCILLIVVAATEARGEDRKPAVIDLDKDDNGSWRLAEAAGACQAKQPAFIRAWCKEKPRKARFVESEQVTAAAVKDMGGSILRITLPVTDEGKGFIPSIIPPPVACDAKTCWYTDTIAAFIRTKKIIAPGDVRTVMFAYDAAGVWQARNWWGPKTTNVAVTLLDEAGKQLTEGTLLMPVR